MRKLLLIPALALTLAFGAVAAASGAQRVYLTQECRTPAVMPAAVVLACADDNIYATRLHYKNYGQKTATATGLIHVNDCTPNCAAGKFHIYPLKIAFKGLVRCSQGRLFYSRAEYTFTGPGGSGKADVQPLGMHCSAVKG